MRFFQVLFLVVLISATTLALPFFNSPTGQAYGGQWRQMYNDDGMDAPQNPRYIMSNRMRG